MPDEEVQDLFWNMLGLSPPWGLSLAFSSAWNLLHSHLHITCSFCSSRCQLRGHLGGDFPLPRVAPSSTWNMALFYYIHGTITIRNYVVYVLILLHIIYHPEIQSLSLRTETVSVMLPATYPGPWLVQYNAVKYNKYSLRLLDKWMCSMEGAKGSNSLGMSG